MSKSWTQSFAWAATPLLVATLAWAPLNADAKTTVCQRTSKAAACKTSTSNTKAVKSVAAQKTTKASTSATKNTAAKARTAAAKPVARTAASAKSVSRAKRPVATAAVGAATLATVPAVLSANTSRSDAASLRSNIAYVQDLETSTVLFAKNEATIAPIASISKLMTALVVVDANQPLDEVLEITSDDIDRVRHAPSRLTVGTRLTRADMLHLALMSSENRAANALGRHYPGGLNAFARAMNSKARSLGMYDTHFVEPTGLSSQNVSSPRDLVRLIRATGQRPLIHRYSTDSEYQVRVGSGRVETFRNTNLLVRKDDWDIRVSKTGFINEAGECLVMLTRVNGRDLAIVLLNSHGKLSRIGDAVRLRDIVQKNVAML